MKGEIQRLGPGCFFSKHTTMKDEFSKCGKVRNHCNCKDLSECGYAAIEAILIAWKQGEGKYPGWKYQPLFDHMSEAHDLSLTKDEMDEILSAAGKVMARQIVALSEQNAINTPIIGEIKL
jgi:hypothetical protein